MQSSISASGDLASVDDGLSGVPTWFGPSSAPLFGVVHFPASRCVRGGIVICPPLGKEHVDSYRGLKLLAQRLASLGFAVLRFDYLGTGDSAGDQGADSAVVNFGASIEAAVEYLRLSGVQDVALVGLRAGALLAAATASTIIGLNAMVLWDPVTDGRRFLREQRVFYKMSVGDDVIDSLTEPILGMTFSKSAATALGALKMPATVDAQTSVLVLARPERADDKRLLTLAAASTCQIHEIHDQAKFVEPISFVVEIPLETTSDIASWLHTTMPTAVSDFSPAICHEATVAALPDGRAVVEVIDELGPNRLFAIRTALGDTPAGAPTVLIHGMACLHRVGSGRIWPEAARELASLGLAVIRYDRQGTGDTGFATTAFPRINSKTSKSDVVDAVDAAGVSPDRLLMTGVCSGGWNSAFAALSRGVRSVVLVNMIMYSLRRVEVGPERLVGMTVQVPGDAPSNRPNGWALVRHYLRRWMPYHAWLLLGKLGLAQVPEVLLGELLRANVITDVVLSPKDHTWFEEQHGKRGMARLARRGRFPTVTKAPSGDHSMLQRDLQNFTRQHLKRAALRDFADLLPAPAAEPAAHRSGNVEVTTCRNDAVACRGRV